MFEGNTRIYVGLSNGSEPRSMKNWHLTLQLPADSNAPVYRRIVATIIGDVERGRIRPGEQLPSSRALAVQLGVHRNTVLAAYDDLAAQGVIRGSPAKGMFVVDPHAPDVESFDLEPNGSRPRTAGFDLGDDVVTEMNFASPCRYVLLGGVPDLRFLPLTELSRAYRAALRSATKKRSLSYGDPLGDEQLRRALGELLTRVRGVSVGPESICVVRGAQAGLYLAARALVRPGDVVALEAYRFPWASEALRLAGASLYPVPVDQDGLDVTVLEALAERTRVRAVYLTPHHQCPTTVALSPDRRRRLLALARRTRMIVLEDDYDFDFHYEGRPRLPLASADRAGVVIYVGTMSKTLAPGLRLGYVVATPDVVKRIAALRFYVDRQGDHVVERAVATLLEEGIVQRHVRRAARMYRRRRDALCEALARRFPALEFSPPAGGMAVWARFRGVDVEGWVRRSREAGVAFQTGRMFRADGGEDDGVRIGFGACDEVEIDEAIERMAAALACGASRNDRP